VFVEILTNVEQVWSEPALKRVVRLCATLSGDPTAADDLAQETLLQAWRIRDRLTDPRGSGPWLDAVARNVCRRWRVHAARSAGHEDLTQAVPETSAFVEDVTTWLEREECLQLLERAMALLPADTRTALVARYVEELPPSRIAERMSMTPEAVSMRLTRGRARLRELLETDLAEDELAQAWVERHGAAWRPTRLTCPTCGRQATRIQRDATAVRLRCDHCEPDGVASMWRLDNPTLAPRIGTLQRPSAIVARMADWAAGWWPDALDRGQVPCTRCGATVAVEAYDRGGVSDVRSERGWAASCSACGEVMSTSLLGLLLATPEARELRTRHPRAFARPSRREHGRVVVGLHDEVSGAGVDAVYDEATSRLVRVVPVA
jgi:RNA polymerase sigma-70 factor (ECF subfamily)